MDDDTCYFVFTDGHVVMLGEQSEGLAVFLAAEFPGAIYFAALLDTDVVC